jgi:peptidoglycan L-alanyl-D-glutamate endopeptidase CwlK
VHLEGIDERLRAVVLDVMALQIMDFSVAEGLRTKERQEKLVASGASKTMNSKHLTGKAVDLYPYPIDMRKVQAGNWVECARFGVLAGMMKTVGQRHGVKIRWGLDWDSDGQTLDQTFFDAPHFELDY